MNEQVSLKQNMINFGLIYGIISILLHVVLYTMNRHLEQDWRMSLLGLIISIIVFTLAIKKCKSINNGFLSIGQAIKTGIGVAALGAIVYAVYNYVFMTFIEPETITQMLEIGREKMIEQNPDMDEDKIDTILNLQKQWAGPGIIGASVIIVNIIAGLIISLISGLILKKDDTSF